MDYNETSTILDITNTVDNKDCGKEILNNLLKKLLGHKLNKLEKKSKEEDSNLKVMSKVSQKIILALEYYSHKVRKEIYLRKHKNDESTKKMINEENSIQKESTKDKETVENIIDENALKEEKKQEKKENKTESIEKKKTEKQVEKSTSPKSEKNNILNTSIKPNKKEKKMDVFSRLASKSIGHFKKFKYDLNGLKNSDNTASTKSIHNTKQNSSNKSQVKMTPKKRKEIKKVIQTTTPGRGKELNLEGMSSRGLVSMKRKTMSIIPDIDIENNNKEARHTYCKTIVGIKKNNDSDITLKNENKIKNKEKGKNISKGNNILSTEANNINIENKDKNNDVKITNTILSKKDKNDNLFKNKNKDLLKESNNHKIFLDDEILKNVNKDELLVSEPLKTSEIMINTINNNQNKNNDSNTSPKKSNEKNINNIKTIHDTNTSSNNNSRNLNNNSSINKQIENQKMSNNINEIILANQNRNLQYLNDDEINFTLIEQDSVKDDVDLNKTIDLNISGLSEQLSLEEKFQAHLDEISRYLENRDLCNIFLLNKESYKTLMNILISKTEITIDILEEEIMKLKETNRDINFDKIQIKPFKFNSNSSRAVSLLNTSSGYNVIKFQKENEKLNKEILLIFDIYFIAAGKKKNIIRLDDQEKMDFITNYFKDSIEKTSLGTLIEKEINGKIFDDDIITSLYKYSYKHIRIISPNHFQKHNKDIAIFVFVIKNILDHLGLLDQSNIKPDKEFILYNARLSYNRKLLDELNKIFDKKN